MGFKKAYNYAGNIKTPFDLIKYRCGLATARTNQKEVIQKMNDTKSLAHEMEPVSYTHLDVYKRQSEKITKT